MKILAHDVRTLLVFIHTRALIYLAVCNNHQIFILIRYFNMYFMRWKKLVVSSTVDRGPVLLPFSSTFDFYGKQG